MPKTQQHRVNRLAVYTPRTGETLTIRGDINSKTTLWAFRLSSPGLWVPGGDEFTMSLQGRIEAADFNPALDDRIAQQRNSIDLMLDHLKEHCPKLLGTGDCAHIGKEKNPR